MSLPSPDDLDGMLRLLERQTVSAAITLLRSGQPVTPSAIGLQRQPDRTLAPVLIPLLDVQQRFEILRTAVAASQLEAFVFLYDGVLQNKAVLNGGQTDTLLIVACTPLTAWGQALPYRKTVDGLRVQDGIPAPPEIAEEYQRRVFVHARTHQA